MNYFKRHPLTSAILIVVLAFCLGALIGGAYGRHEVRLIAEEARKTHPDDPLDGLAIIGFGYAVIGMAYGMASGLVLGLIAYIWIKRRSKLP